LLDLPRHSGAYIAIGGPGNHGLCSSKEAHDTQLFPASLWPYAKAALSVTMKFNGAPRPATCKTIVSELWFTEQPPIAKDEIRYSHVSTLIRDGPK